MRQLSFRTDEPFAITPNPRFAFESSSYLKASVTLASGIEQCAGLMVLLGPAGCGKTMLLQAIQDTLSSKRKFVFLSSSPDQTLEDLLGLLLAELRLSPVSSSHEDRVDALTCYLRQCKAPAVLLVDDAHRLPDSTLAGLAGLIAFQRGEPESLRMVLSGRRLLAKRLKRRELAWVTDFVAVTARLDPLAPDELPNYVAHRLEIARHSLLSARRARNPFEPPALEQVFRYSQGVPRTVNRLCQCALSRNPNRVDAARIDEVAFECGLAPPLESYQAAAARVFTAGPEWSSDERGIDVRKPRKLSSEWLRVGYRAAAVVIAAGFGATFAYQAYSSRDVVSLVARVSQAAWAPIASRRVALLEEGAPVVQVGSELVETMVAAPADPAPAEDWSPSQSASPPEAAAEPVAASTPNDPSDAAARNDADGSAHLIVDHAASPDTVFDAQHGSSLPEPDDTRDRAQTADPEEDATEINEAEIMADQAPDAVDTIPDTQSRMPDTPIVPPASTPLFAREDSWSGDERSDQNQDPRSTTTTPLRPIEGGRGRPRPSNPKRFPPK